ncbi:MAG: hypothetical protein IJU50_03350 [Lachnospiraceae bacterium]|nr:hypothetical protein [Lachnospiraceae bacterium]
MNNLIAFLAVFKDYLVLYLLAIALVVGAVVLGAKLRIRKDEKDAATPKEAE